MSNIQKGDSFKQNNYPLPQLAGWLVPRICIHPLDWAIGQAGDPSGNSILILLSHYHADKVFASNVL